MNPSGGRNQYQSDGNENFKLAENQPRPLRCPRDYLMRGYSISRAIKSWQPLNPVADILRRPSQPGEQESFNGGSD